MCICCEKSIRVVVPAVQGVGSLETASMDKKRLLQCSQVKIHTHTCTHTHTYTHYMFYSEKYKQFCHFSGEPKDCSKQKNFQLSFRCSVFGGNSFLKVLL